MLTSSAGAAAPGHSFQEVARIGVSKINVNSDLRYAYRTKLESQRKDDPTSTLVRFNHHTARNTGRR